MVPDRKYTPGIATQNDLSNHLQRLGLQRAVIVQPSVYGTDNRYMLNALAASGGRARGVAVVDESVEDGTLEALHTAGVRGLRVNHESAHHCDASGLLATLRRWARRIEGLPWHLQVYASWDSAAYTAAHIDSIGVPVVLDHFAMVPTGTPRRDPRLQQILNAVRSGQIWVKLSGAYRIGVDQDGITDLAHAYLDERIDRVLWGSDWPHTNRELGKTSFEVSAYRNISPERLLQQIADWLPGKATRAVLVDNPRALYEFN